MTTLHRKPRGVPTATAVDVLPSRVDERSESTDRSIRGEKVRRPKKLAPTHVAPLKQQRRMSTTQLRALCAVCLLVYLGALCFAQDIVRLGAAVRSDAARQRLFSPWHPVRSAVTAAVAATRPLLRAAAAPTNEPDDDAADADSVGAAAVGVGAGIIRGDQLEAETSIAPSETAEREATEAGTVPPTPAAAAVPTELKRADRGVGQQEEHEREPETVEGEDVAEDDSVALAVDGADEERMAKTAERSKAADIASAETLMSEVLRSFPATAVVVKQDPPTKLADERRSPPSEVVKADHEQTPATTDKAPPPLGVRRSPPSEADRADQDPFTDQVAERVHIFAVATTPAATTATTADSTAELSSMKLQEPADAPDSTPFATAAVVLATPTESTLAVVEGRQKVATEDADGASSEPTRR